MRLLHYHRANLCNGDIGRVLRVSMITGRRSSFAARCRQRGYTLDEVRECIVSEDGDQIVVDETHASYPRHAKPGSIPPPTPRPTPPSGPGTELKALLKTIGITASPTCSCNKRAKVMDHKGADWCEEHIDEIDGWLAEEAKKRKLPYLSLAGKTLIRLAIRRARKKGNGR
jgi:hypothetical protein